MARLLVQGLRLTAGIDAQDWDLITDIGRGGCDTGVISKPECGGIKRVIRLLSIIHNGIILDLVCGFRW